MLSMRVGEAPRLRGDGPRLIIDCDDVGELLADCRAMLATGRIVVMAARRFDDGAAVKLQLAAGALVSPLVIATTVATGCGDRGGEVTLELEPREQERLAELVDRLEASDPTVVAPVRRVLIDDDNPHLVELIRAGLIGVAQRGPGAPPRLEFAVARDGAAAVAALDVARVDVALIGVYLPPLAPGQVIAAARARWGRGVGVIALAGDDAPAQRLAFAAGADVFMSKPVRLRALHEAIAALAARAEGPRA